MESKGPRFFWWLNLMDMSFPLVEDCDPKRCQRPEGSMIFWQMRFVPPDVQMYRWDRDESSCWENWDLNPKVTKIVPNMKKGTGQWWQQRTESQAVGVNVTWSSQLGMLKLDESDSWCFYVFFILWWNFTPPKTLPIIQQTVLNMFKQHFTSHQLKLFCDKSWKRWTTFVSFLWCFL